MTRCHLILFFNVTQYMRKYYARARTFLQGVHELRQSIFVFLHTPFKVVNFRIMITIWKLTISTFRLGKPKFSKISFKMVAYRPKCTD